jgi:hypothetical protein
MTHLGLALLAVVLALAQSQEESNQKPSIGLKDGHLEIRSPKGRVLMGDADVLADLDGCRSAVSAFESSREQLQAEISQARVGHLLFIEVILLKEAIILRAFFLGDDVTVALLFLLQYLSRFTSFPPFLTHPTEYTVRATRPEHAPFHSDHSGTRTPCPPEGRLCSSQQHDPVLQLR